MALAAVALALEQRGVNCLCTGKRGRRSPAASRAIECKSDPCDPPIEDGVQSLACNRSRRARSGLTAIAAAFAALVCVTTPRLATSDSLVLNTSLAPIDLRYGLHVEDIELAILLAIVDPLEPPAVTPEQEITDELLSEILDGTPSRRRPDNPWSFQGREPGRIFAGYERGRVSMRVAIRFDDQFVLLRIVESRNFGQTGNRIRDEALTLLADLDRRIRRTVLVVAQRNRYGAPIPAAPARGALP